MRALFHGSVASSTLPQWASRRQTRSSSRRTVDTFEDVPSPRRHDTDSNGSHAFQERDAELDP